MSLRRPLAGPNSWSHVHAIHSATRHKSQKASESSGKVFLIFIDRLIFLGALRDAAASFFCSYAVRKQLGDSLVEKARPMLSY
jgi:hypothetical protein